MKEKRTIRACVSLVLFTLVYLLLLPPMGVALKQYVGKTFQVWPMLWSLYLGAPLLGAALCGTAWAVFTAPSSKALLWVEAGAMGLTALCFADRCGWLALQIAKTVEPHKVLFYGGLLAVFLAATLQKRR